MFLNFPKFNLLCFSQLDFISMENIKKSANRFKHMSLFLIGIVLLILGIHTPPAYSQELNVGSGTYLVNSGMMVVVSNARILNAGTIANNATSSIKLTGNWQNDGTYTGVAGSAVTLNGSSAQAIGGARAICSISQPWIQPVILHRWMW